MRHDGVNASKAETRDIGMRHGRMKLGWLEAEGVKRGTWVAVAGAGLLWALTAGAQGAASPQKGAPTTPGSSTPAAGAPRPERSAQAPVDAKLTEAQKKELLASEQEIFEFASHDTGLKIVHPVKTVFMTRAEVNKELRQKFEEDKSNKRMERSELVLKKFGLLDPDFKLRDFLLSLLTEQIAGFYDNKTKMMHLLDWVPIDQQKPVMAHELTHALQDQRLGLTKWEDPQPEGVAKNAAEDNVHIQTDETGTAREAVLEGQAMVSFADYLLRPTGKTLKDAPQVGRELENGAGDSSDSPVLARAPLVLQQALLFPYTAGLSFESDVLGKAGVPRAFAGVLDEPPNSSMEVMHPAAYLGHAAVPVMRLPDLHPVLEKAGYAPYDVGVMGELDVRMTAELFGGRPLAEALAPNWAGGVYYAAQRKSASEQEKASTRSLALLYSSHWKNPDSARSFLHVFEEQLPRQYDGLTRREKDEKDADERVYTTREGDVLLSLKDNVVWVSEGFDVELARQMREQVDAANAAAGTGPFRTASVSLPVASLTGHLGTWIDSFGVMKAAMRKF